MFVHMNITYLFHSLINLVLGEILHISNPIKVTSSGCRILKMSHPVKVILFRGVWVGSSTFNIQSVTSMGDWDPLHSTSIQRHIVWGVEVSSTSDQPNWMHLSSETKLTSTAICQHRLSPCQHKYPLNNVLWPKIGIPQEKMGRLYYQLGGVITPWSGSLPQALPWSLMTICVTWHVWRYILHENVQPVKNESLLCLVSKF